MPTNFRSALEASLSRAIPGFQALEECRKLTAGASQETYRLSLQTSDGPQRLALRRSPPDQASGSGVGTISLDTEARLFQMAAAGGIPGPRIIHVLSEDDQLGEGFFMEWLAGETLGQRIVRAEEFADVRPQLAYQCGQILGQIHNLDWRAAGLQNTLPAIEPGKLVDETWAGYRDLNVPEPMIDFTWRWLKENLPEQSRSTLVHGDFRNGNLMVTPAGINAVLDWELAHVGDPVRDLGWLCVNSWRFGKSALPVGGFGHTAELLAGYQQATGVEVSSQELVFWQVFGSFWWATTTLQMANAWRTGETPSLERPVIGRRSSEAQMDCVNLLIPGEFDLPETATSIATGTRLPMPAELLAGVASFLKDEVATQLDTHNRFLARVAANSLGIAQREFQYGPELAARETASLNILLGRADDLDALRWDLVHQLRQGLALDTPGLAVHLRQTVAGQLLVDQPHYSALSMQKIC